MTNFAAARHNMVESQLRTNKVTNTAIIEAFEAVPRELFVPKSYRGIAYLDEDLPIGDGRHLMEPLVLARLLQEARIAATDAVLDIGCATGYSTVVLARLAASVLGLEAVEPMVDEANRLLTELNCDNAAVIQGALPEGYAKQAPYNVIVLNGAVETIPAALVDQLAEGGRLVAVLREPGQIAGVGRAVIVSKTGGVASRRVLFDAATPLLPGFAKELGFVF